jgi:hypothetical protein
MTIEYPKTEPDPNGRGTITTHPAYAQIQAARVTGGMYLYGSDFQHNQHIRIHISKSQVIRDLSNDWYHDGRELIEVCLSEAQWATFVSILNVGGGVPCTINHLMGEHMPDLPAPPKVDQKFRQELLERQESAIKALSEAVEMLGSALNKGQALAVKNLVEKAKTQISGNTKFVVTQFDEHVETVEGESKCMT